MPTPVAPLCLPPPPDLPASPPPCRIPLVRSPSPASTPQASYEGEHNHPCHKRTGELPAGCSTTRSGSMPFSISINSSVPTITLDLTKNGGGVQVVEAAKAPPDLKKVCQEVASPEFRRALMEQMASALTSDPKFNGALAVPIL